MQRNAQELTPAYQFEQPVRLPLRRALGQRQAAGDGKYPPQVAGLEIDAHAVLPAQRDQALMSQISPRGLRREKIFTGKRHEGSGERWAGSKRLDHDQDDDDEQHDDRQFDEPAVPDMTAPVAPGFEFFQQRAAGMVITDQHQHQRELRMQPAVSLPLADAVSKPQPQAE